MGYGLHRENNHMLVMRYLFTTFFMNKSFYLKLSPEDQMEKEKSQEIDHWMLNFWQRNHMTIATIVVIMLTAATSFRIFRAATTTFLGCRKLLLSLASCFSQFYLVVQNQKILVLYNSVPPRLWKDHSAHPYPQSIQIFS